MRANERLKAWREAEGLSQEALAERLGCSQSLVSFIEIGKRTANLALALTIERESADWRDGPIRAQEWVAEGPTLPPTGTDD